MGIFSPGASLFAQTEAPRAMPTARDGSALEETLPIAFDNGCPGMCGMGSYQRCSKMGTCTMAFSNYGFSSGCSSPLHRSWGGWGWFMLPLRIPLGVCWGILGFMIDVVFYLTYICTAGYICTLFGEERRCFKFPWTYVAGADLRHASEINKKILHWDRGHDIRSPVQCLHVCCCVYPYGSDLHTTCSWCCDAVPKEKVMEEVASQPAAQTPVAVGGGPGTAPEQ